MSHVSPSLPNTLWRRVGPFAVFTALVMLYFYPALRNHLVLAPGDGYFYYYPVRVALQQTLASHHLPLWNPYTFAGFPAAADPQVGAFFPLTWLFFFLSPSVAMNLLVLSSYILAGAFTVLYAREVGLDEWGAYGAGVVFAFGGFMVAHLGHLTMITAAPCLPLLLYCLEKLRTSVRWRCVAGGAAAFAASIFAGHPQMPTYIAMVAALYLLFFSLIERPPVGRLRYLLTGMLTLFMGLLLAAAQILPTRELGLQSVRETMTYELFTSFSLPFSHLLLFLFPYLFGWNVPYEAYGVYRVPVYRTPWWGAWNFTELAGYVGIIPLMVSVAIVPLARRATHLLFWLSLAVITLLLALGGNTPLARVTFHFPGLNVFRAPARHLMEFNLAMAMLVGFAMTLLPRLAKTRLRRLVGVGVGVILLPALGVWIGFPYLRDQLIRAVASNPGASLPADPLTLISAPLLTPALLALLGGAAALVFAWKPGVFSKSLLLGVLCLDLYLFGQDLEWRHASPVAEEREAMLVALRQLYDIDPLHAQSRILSLEEGAKRPGRLKDWALHPNRLMLHGTRNVSGYDPLVTARYTNLVGDDVVLPAGANRALDLLNVKYLLVSDSRLSPPTPMQVGGFRFASTPLDRDLSPSVLRREFSMGGAPVTDLALISGMGGSLSIKDDQPVARVTIWTDRNRRIEQLILAGRDTAEWAWDRPDVTALVKHRKATVAEDQPGAAKEDFVGHRYLAALSLGERVSVTRVVFEYLLPEAGLSLYRLSLYDAATAASSPVTRLHEALADPSRWQERLWADGVGIFENRRALPRAWLVSRVRNLPPDHILQSIRTGRLPDGRPFDPRELALIEGGADLDLGPLDPLMAGAEVTEDGPNGLIVTTSSDRPAFLVLSEAFLPGWTAHLDEQPAAIVRTNYLLRGLPLPAGNHQIRFTYVPDGLRLGALISGAALLVLIGLVWVGRIR